MKVNNFEPKELKAIVKKLESRVSILKKKESLLHKLKRWLFGEVV